MSETSNRTSEKAVPPPYLPTRIRGGRVEEGEFVVETGSGETAIPWGMIRLLCLGVIEETARGAEAEPSKLRSMIRKVLLGAPDDESHHKMRQTRLRRSYYFDFFVEGREQAYRIESTSVSYKGILPAGPRAVEWEREEWRDATLVGPSKAGVPSVNVPRVVTSDFRYPTSMDNFRSLLGIFLERLPAADLNSPLTFYKEKKRLEERTYPSLYEFQMEAMEMWKRVRTGNRPRAPEGSGPAAGARTSEPAASSPFSRLELEGGEQPTGAEGSGDRPGKMEGPGNPPGKMEQ